MGEARDGSGENVAEEGFCRIGRGEEGSISGSSEERREAAAFGGAPVVQWCSGDVREEERWWRRYSAEGLGERESGRGLLCCVKK